MVSSLEVLEKSLGAPFISGSTGTHVIHPFSGVLQCAVHSYSENCIDKDSHCSGLGITQRRYAMFAEGAAEMLGTSFLALLNAETGRCHALT